MVLLAADIDFGTETAQYVNDETDHHKIDADVEQHRGHQMMLAQHGEVKIDDKTLEGLTTEDQRHHTGEAGHRQAPPHQRSGREGNSGFQLVAATCQVSQHEG